MRKYGLSIVQWLEQLQASVTHELCSSDDEAESRKSRAMRMTLKQGRQDTQTSQLGVISTAKDAVLFQRQKGYVEQYLDCLTALSDEAFDVSMKCSIIRALLELNGEWVRGPLLRRILESSTKLSDLVRSKAFAFMFAILASEQNSQSFVSDLTFGRDLMRKPGTFAVANKVVVIRSGSADLIEKIFALLRVNCGLSLGSDRTIPLMSLFKHKRFIPCISSERLFHLVDQRKQLGNFDGWFSSANIDLARRQVFTQIKQKRLGVFGQKRWKRGFLLYTTDSNTVEAFFSVVDLNRWHVLHFQVVITLELQAAAESNFACVRSKKAAQLMDVLCFYAALDDVNCVRSVLKATKRGEFNKQVLDYYCGIYEDWTSECQRSRSPLFIALAYGSHRCALLLAEYVSLSENMIARLTKGLIHEYCRQHGLQYRRQDPQLQDLSGKIKEVKVKLMQHALVSSTSIKANRWDPIVVPPSKVRSK